ncbi:hypothetical protein EW026_g3064 [Hermanssonia centrifuga]|uniref:SH3 domain-containing protein n=1 Tax=Hermanssonia centrifuga TaxID=98765 RepID=A0A4S4KLV4_9APHY|nr:hypothetical protein EW026_g3064 [Hermanssonia centrifuga]
MRRTGGRYRATMDAVRRHRSFHTRSVPSHQSSYASDKYTDDGRPILFYVKALYDYQATIDEEFDFQADDIIAVTETPEDGWWSGELQIEKKKRQPGRHIFPSNLVSRHESVASHQSPSASGKFAENGRPILFYVKALYDYQATIDEEFNFQAGDIIAVTATPEDGWWRGELVDEKKRQHGRYVFPSNFVGLLP